MTVARQSPDGSDFTAAVTRQDIVLPAMLAALLLALFLYQGFDIGLSAYFFDPASGRFPLEHDWWHEKLLHADVKQGVRRIVILMGLAFIASLVVARLKPYRRLLLFVVAASLLSASVVSTFKNASYQACPFSLIQFGGNRPYIGPFDPVPADIGLGRCSPGGHAASAFSLFPLYFAARHLRRRRLATGMFWFVMLFGLLLTYVQVARGMHLFSHQIWTALICWYVSLATYRLFFLTGNRRGNKEDGYPVPVAGHWIPATGHAVPPAPTFPAGLTPPLRRAPAGRRDSLT
ncbi:MAG: phosphatase PAP2 family protein [Rhodocyclaceae bacterium]|jgi:membrane-associated PAP2 superfamily phosphatase|nr:phosphatase PAP2 family protein [Rhodocyclaceae bacterium]